MVVSYYSKWQSCRENQTTVVPDSTAGVTSPLVSFTCAGLSCSSLLCGLFAPSFGSASVPGTELPEVCSLSSGSSATAGWAPADDSAGGLFSRQMSGPNYFIFPSPKPINSRRLYLSEVEDPVAQRSPQSHMMTPVQVVLVHTLTHGRQTPQVQRPQLLIPPKNQTSHHDIQDREAWFNHSGLFPL